MAHFVVPHQGKLQKHQAFEAEVQANSGAIIKLDETGNLMISEGHFASETIRVSAVHARRGRSDQGGRGVGVRLTCQLGSQTARLFSGFQRVYSHQESCPNPTFVMRFSMNGNQCWYTR